MLTAAQKRQREGKFTASRGPWVVMNGTEQDLMDLWSEMVGDPSYQPEDLSGVWPIRLGDATEQANLDWYEFKTGRKLTRRGEVVVVPVLEWPAATLDGWDNVMMGPVDAKHVGGWEPREKVIARYTPQLFWQMIVTDARWSALSLIEGAREPVIEEVLWEQEYAAELWRRAEAFMESVWSLTPPVALPPVATPEPITKFRAVDMTGSNIWAENAAIWLEHHPAAKKFEKASKELKELVAADVGKASGHGLCVKRDKANRLSISAMK